MNVINFFKTWRAYRKWVKLRNDEIKLFESLNKSLRRAAMSAWGFTADMKTMFINCPFCREELSIEKPLGPERIIFECPHCLRSINMVASGCWIYGYGPGVVGHREHADENQ